MNHRVACLTLMLLVPIELRAAGPEMERVVIDDNFPGGYQVEVADVNGDGKPDLVAVGGGTCAWYENPSWTKRIVTGPDRTPGIISSATADLDGDGKAEIAIAYDFSMNEPTKGKLLLAGQGKGPDDPWTVVQVADVPSIHRLRWFCQAIKSPQSTRVAPVLPGRNPLAKEEESLGMSLLVAPLFGPSARPPAYQQEPAHMVAFSFQPRAKANLPAGTIGTVGTAGGGFGGAIAGGASPLTAKPTAPLLLGKWEFPVPRDATLGGAPVLHAVEVVCREDRGGEPEILAASNLGVTRRYFAFVDGTRFYRTETLVAGAPGEAPKKGASEIHSGRLKNGTRFLATVEPWHGTDVAVYLAESKEPFAKFGSRTVIDTTLVEGHALWVADFDGDGDDEIVAGYRGGAAGVNLYRRDGAGWTQTVLDPTVAAQDLRGGDLDGDGRPDVVAIGGKTHNVVWYRPIRRP